MRSADYATFNEFFARDFKNIDVQLNAKIRQALVGRQLTKGEMFSFFQFGSSDCVMVFERRANVNITAQVGVHYPIRSQYDEGALCPAAFERPEGINTIRFAHLGRKTERVFARVQAS